jgi:Protein of unknown function (DUF3047)
MGKHALRFAAYGLISVLAIAIVGFLGFRHLTNPPTSENPVIAGSDTSISVMDFSKPFPLSPLPAGWWHLKFLTKPPMNYSFAEKTGVKALRCQTDASGSILGRHTDIDLAQFPTLTWSWLVEVPVIAPVPEMESRGDDHPARLLLMFADDKGSEHHLEIIWSNGAFKAGEWKYIGNFPHFVANGGDARIGENTGVWFDENVNLLNLYRTATKRTDAPRLKYISIFCDTDDTGTKSTAYFANVRLEK